MSTTIKTSAGTQPIDPYKAKNYENPPLKEKVEDLVRFIESTKYGMMTTKASDSDLLSSRCMSLAATEHGGIDLIFHTNLFSGKTADLNIHPTEVNMSFLDIVSGSWASVSGTASLLSDPAIVHKYYTPALQAWLGDLGDGVHDGGPDDPRIGVIRLEAKFVTYALSKKGIISKAVETGKAVAKGEAPSISRLREITEEELAQWRQSHPE